MGVPGTGGLEVVSHPADLTFPHTLLPVNLNFKPIVIFSSLRDAMDTPFTVRLCSYCVGQVVVLLPYASSAACFLVETYSKWKFHHRFPKSSTSLSFHGKGYENLCMSWPSNLIDGVVERNAFSM